MQLPSFSFSGPMPTAEVGAAEHAAGEAQRLGSTIEQGLTAFGHSVVMSQTADAHLAATKGLDEVDDFIKTHPAVSQDDLKTMLGDRFDQLPDAVKNQPPQPVLDENGQQVLDGDRPAMKAGDVPMWMVGHALYETRAQQVLDQAQQHITVGSGWQSQFQRAALQDVQARGAKISEHLNQQALEDQQSKVHLQVLQLARAGDFNTANAIVDARLDVLGTEGQRQAKAMVAGAQQEAPVTNALLEFRTRPDSPDVTEKLKDAQAALADERQTGLLPLEKRASLARAVEAALKTQEEGQHKRVAAGIALEAIQASPDPLNPDKADATSVQKKIAARFAPGGDLHDRPELYFEAQSLAAKQTSDQNAAAKQSFDSLAGSATQLYLGLDKTGQYHPSAHNVTAYPQLVAALHAAGKEGEDLLNQFRLWDRANEMDARTKRNTPTDAEEGRAFRIERSIAVNPGAWRALSGADQMKILAGQAPVPGEPDAPVVAVSARDVPGLSTKIAAVAASVPPKYVTSPEKVAQEEAEAAYPDLKKEAGKQSHAARVALADLSTRIATFMDAERNRSGKEPPQAEVRKEAARLMQTVEVRRMFWFNRKTTRLQAEKEGVDFIEPDAPEAPAGAPAAAPAKPPPPPQGTPQGWIPYRNAKTGEVRYNAPGKAKGDWAEAR